MENLEITTPEVKKTSTRHFDTMDESIVKMKMAFGNALLPEIFAVMVTVGYTVEKIEGMKAELSQLETLCQGQIKESADQGTEQDKFDDERAEINEVFNKNRSLTRILFKGDIHAWVALQLDTANPKAYPAWVQLLTNYYAQIAATPALQAKVQTVGITASAVSAQSQALLDLQTLKESLSNETGEAQAATDTRNCAFDALYPQYSEYIKYAKILLAGNQILEAIGVKVKAK
ncbi:MAG TPA: hypothetical protein VIK29_01900 [Paludibacter sp.]